MLENYPGAIPLDIDFTIEIEEAKSFVFVPPKPDEEEKKEEEVVEEETEAEIVDAPTFIGFVVPPAEKEEKVLNQADFAANEIREGVNEDQ